MHLAGLECSFRVFISGAQLSSNSLLGNEHRILPSCYYSPTSASLWWSIPSIILLMITPLVPFPLHGNWNPTMKYIRLWRAGSAGSAENQIGDVHFLLGGEVDAPGHCRQVLDPCCAELLPLTSEDASPFHPYPSLLDASPWGSRYYSRQLCI